MSAGIAGQQADPRTNVRPRQFQLAAALANVLTVAAAATVPPKAVPFKFRLRNIGDDVVVVFAGWLQVRAAALLADVGTHVMLGKFRVRRRSGAKHARVLPMLCTAAISRRPLSSGTLASRAFAPLQKRLQLLLKLRNPPPQLGILSLQFGNPAITWVIHDPRNLTENAKPEKINCLTVTAEEAHQLHVWEIDRGLYF
jgi:hypothetical protein